MEKEITKISDNRYSVKTPGYWISAPTLAKAKLILKKAKMIKRLELQINKLARYSY